LSAAGLVALAGLAVAPATTFAQGCVAAHGAGLTGVHEGFAAGSGEFTPGDLEVSLGYRWFRSHRHFVGDVEQTQRAQQQTEVINDSNFFNLGLAYDLNERLRLRVGIPFAAHTRSQVARAADGTNLDRFQTSAAGIGDIQFMADIWLLGPSQERRWNALLGFGFAAPTGNDASRDVFEIYDRTTNRLYARQQPVDESIQLGIGGWGFPLELFVYRQLSDHLQGYLEGAYTLTPRDRNNTLTFRSNPYEAVNSVADSYLGRLGADFEVSRKLGVNASLGARIEGVPVRDLIGGSEGFRRPGYTVSIEPGLSVAGSKWVFSVYAPVALYRNRLQSVPDQEQTAATGVYQHGDAAFADYSIISNLSWRW
jgi:hypothetical protein